jgi:hypothetical protein
MVYQILYVTKILFDDDKYAELREKMKPEVLDQ